MSILTVLVPLTLVVVCARSGDTCSPVVVKVVAGTFLPVTAMLLVAVKRNEWTAFVAVAARRMVLAGSVARCAAVVAVGLTVADGAPAVDVGAAGDDAAVGAAVVARAVVGLGKTASDVGVGPFAAVVAVGATVGVAVAFGVAEGLAGPEQAASAILTRIASERSIKSWSRRAAIASTPLAAICLPAIVANEPPHPIVPGAFRPRLTERGRSGCVVLRDGLQAIERLSWPLIR
jgi:hypothetical protein